MSDGQIVAGLEEVWEAVGALPAALPLPAAREERHLPGRGVGWEPNSDSEAVGSAGIRSSSPGDQGGCFLGRASGLRRLGRMKDLRSS